MSGLAAIIIGVPLVSTAAAGFGAYKGLEAATGRFGQDEADAVKSASEAQDALAKQAQSGAAQAGAGAQAGLDPYAQTGMDANAQMRALAGLDGAEAQAAAFAMIQNSPGFQAAVQQQEQAILANGSATGGLRGGNMQDALAGNRSDLFAQFIQQQLSQFGGLAGQGQQAAAQQGAFGLNAAGLSADILGQRGAIQAGGILGQQAALTNGRNQAVNLGMQGAGAALNLGLGGGIPMGGGVGKPPGGGGF